MEFPGSWDRYIPLMEFSYNNSYQASIGMAPYKIYMVRDVELWYVGQS